MIVSSREREREGRKGEREGSGAERRGPERTHITPFTGLCSTVPMGYSEYSHHALHCALLDRAVARACARQVTVPRTGLSCAKAANHTA